MTSTRQRAAFWTRAALESGTCLAIGLFIGLVMLGVGLEEGGGDLPGRSAAILAVDLLLGIPACLLVGPLRTRGRWNLIIAAALPLSTIALPAGLLALVRLGALRSMRVEVGILAWLLVGSVLYDALDPLSTGLLDPLVLASAVLSVAVSAALLMWGRSRATRAALIVSLRAQAAAAEQQRAAAEREREHAVGQVRAEERAAIARDMHDSLSHHLSVIAMGAGAIAYRDDLPPEAVRSTAGNLREAAAAANAELREVLLALRSADEAAASGAASRSGTALTAPLPTGRSLHRLVETAREAGQDVTFHLEGLELTDLDRLSRATAVALERMTGELLANAAKHAPGLPVELELRREDDGGGGGDAIVLRATNPLRGAAHPDEAKPLTSGYGLVGVDERARLLGGEARYGIIDDDGVDSFRTEVRIPWTR